MNTERNLKFITDNQVEFTKYPPFGEPYRIRCVLTDYEAKKAKELLNSKDDFAIDNFCYSIA